MAAPKMTSDDVGEFFQRQDGSVWRLIGRQDGPSATLERVFPNETTDAAVDAVLDADLVLAYLPAPDTTDGARARDALDRLRRRALDGIHHQRVSGGIGAPIFDGFERLVNDDGTQVARCVYPGCGMSDLQDVGRFRTTGARVFVCRPHLDWLRSAGDADANVIFEVPL